jgi:cellulose synthase/poly-beta-1,6-N-acetylglucosamine synthase-like glycosyltransferase
LLVDMPRATHCVQSLHQLARTLNTFYFAVNSLDVFFYFFYANVLASGAGMIGQRINHATPTIDLKRILWLTLGMTTLLYTMLLVPLALLFHAWIAYPLLLLTRTRRSERTVPGTTPSPAPTLVIVLSAFNEAEVIAGRIANIIATDYPAGKLRVLIGTDGCTDETAARACEAAAATPWIEVIAFERNRGKVAVLRDLVATAQRQAADTHDTLFVFTDANTRFRPDALRQLVRHFADPAVGGVCGRLVFTGSGSDAEHTYWNLENELKRRESQIDSCLGANGAIYALRPECFWQAIPASTIVDDFVIGMKVREAGWRMLYDPDAVAEEDVPEVQAEWQRRVRIGSGDYQAARLCRACLHPRFGRFAACFWSHKILRWFTPHLVLIMLTATALSLTCCRTTHSGTPLLPIALSVAGGSVLLLAGALAGRLARRLAWNGAPWQLCRGLDHFGTMQAALLVGFVRACRGNLSGAWSRTPRTST